MKIANAGLVCMSLLICRCAGAAEAVGPATLENDVLRITLTPRDASLTIQDKRTGLVWRQTPQPGFHVAPEQIRATPTSLSATVAGKSGNLGLTITFTRDCPHAFDLSLDSPGRAYLETPGYPFPFAAPDKGWFYVQNTTGEGALMPMDSPQGIQKPFTWGGGQPWWGITDLKRSMISRLDTFRNPDGRNNAQDHTVYAMPMRVNYAFYPDGGYVGLAKEYRKHLLAAHPEMRPLSERVQARPAVDHLRDSVYMYFWCKTPAESLAIAREMKAAGVDRGIAMFYGRVEIDRPLFDGIKQQGWLAGTYRMATGNLFHVSRNQGWPNALLSGRTTVEKFLASSNVKALDRVCAQHLVPEWTEKAKEAIRDYGVQAFYFDTLVVQMAPCPSPAHPSTIEENQQGRLQIMKNTRDLGTLVGSGEGNCPTWALPQLDFFEGLMSLRTYGDIPLKVPSGDYSKELGEDYVTKAPMALNERLRIPLYQLGFHDYVAGTWVWRDTNYQSTPYAWKKDLFNILYGTMPMWHIDRGLWDAHKADFVASYRKIASVRQRIGFAEMLNHGWLTEDRSVQFTDWSTGNRVIVNFGDKPFARGGKESVAARSFLVE